MTDVGVKEAVTEGCKKRNEEIQAPVKYKNCDSGIFKPNVVWHCTLEPGIDCAEGVL